MGFDGTAGGRAWSWERRARRPVLCAADVAVAGAGISGVFAALAAARCGAKTVLIERFPALGGNMGPGLILAGGLFREADVTLPGGLRGIPCEWARRVAALRAGPEGRYPEEAGIASHVLFQMCREAGVMVLLGVLAADPIRRGRTVRGLFVETRGGRMAVRARVVVDGTGNAEIARRAGAPMVPFLAIRPGRGVDPRYRTAAVPAGMIRDRYMDRAYPDHFNETHLLCLVANVRRAAYRRFMKSPAARTGAWRRAYTLDRAFSPRIRMGTGVATLALRDDGGVHGFHVTARGAIDPHDPVLLARLEGELRARAFEAVQFLRRHVPGCERAYLLAVSPYLGFRGGPHAAGDHTLTVEEMFAATRFDDVLYRNIHEANHGGDPAGFDVPYRAVLPRGVDGLLVCGRGAAYLRREHDPTGLRARPSMMVLGQAVGTAAAIAARDGVAPRRVDIRKVQRRLRKDGIVLGDTPRLKERGLA